MDTRCPAPSATLAEVGAPCRAGFIIPSAHCGGAERWTLDLVRHCDPARVMWSGCIVTQEWRDSVMFSSLSRVLPVHQKGITVSGSAERREPLDQAFVALVEHSDVLLAWEVDDRIDSLIGASSVPVVHVCHRESTIEPRFVREGQHLAAVSEGSRRSFGAQRVVDVRVIPNGVDLGRCRAVRPRDEMRRLWGCGDDSLVIGYLGRIDAAKNCQAIARAIGGLGGDAIAVCYGPPGIGAEAALREMRAVGGDRMRMLPPVEDVGSVLNALDVFMLPSRSEAHSLALLEAWGAFLPVVATRVGSVPELEASFGSLAVPIAPDDSAERLAGAIRIALSDTQDMRGMRQRAYRMVSEHFRADQMAAAWTEYLSTCARPERP